jgi:hypothetical protein
MREANGRLQALLEREAPKFLGNVRPGGHLPGNSGCKRGISRSARNGFAFGIQEHVARRCGRRHFPCIDQQVETVAGAMQEVEPASTEARAPRFGDFECRADRHGCIERIAARRQDLEPRLARERIGTGDGRNRWLVRFIGKRPLREEQQREQGGKPRAV